MGKQGSALGVTTMAAAAHAPLSGNGFSPGCKNAFEHWTHPENDPELSAARSAMLFSQWDHGEDSLSALAAMVRYVEACEARARALVANGVRQHGHEIMVQCLVDVTSLVRRGGQRAEELKRDLESRFSPNGIKIVAEFFAKRDAGELPVGPDLVVSDDEEGAE